MLKAVIFDMDGVLLDSESRHYPVLRALMEEYGFTYTPEHFRRYCGVPEPDMFLLAAEELGAAPADCMVVEDSANGMIAARQAGMKWVGFSGAEIPAAVRRAAWQTSLSTAPYVCAVCP